MRRALRLRRNQKDLVFALALALVVWLVWGFAYRMFEDQRFTDPLSYGGDAHFASALVAASRRGEYLPFVSKLVPSLGAPFVANWNDFPVSEDLHFFVAGLLARGLGVFGAINLLFLGALIAAALSFFFAARRLRHDRWFAFMGGLLYGLSLYAFSRGVYHFVLVFFWFLPLVALVALWVGSREGVRFKSGRFAFGAVVFLIAGWSNPYYLFFALQVLGLAFFAHLARRKSPRRLGALGLGLVGVLGFLSVNADTLLYEASHGKNPGVLSRQASDAEWYALKPVNLFAPGGNHHFAFMRELAHRRDVNQVTTGEAPNPYLGLVGAALFLSMLGVTLVRTARREVDFGVVCTLFVAWLVAFHSVGGVNSLLALFDFKLFRSVNRVSIMVLAWVLLFGTWWLPRLLKRLPRPARAAVALLLAAFGVWDQLPVLRDARAVEWDRRISTADRLLVREAETRLGDGAHVFVLPAMDFPEVQPVGGVGVYDLFRPTFFTRTLVFSHGDDKGRPDAQWKFRTATLPAPAMVAELRARGFSGIYLDKRAFPEGARALIASLEAAGARVVATSSENDTLFLAL